MMSIHELYRKHVGRDEVDISRLRDAVAFELREHKAGKRSYMSASLVREMRGEQQFIGREFNRRNTK